MTVDTNCRTRYVIQFAATPTRPTMTFWSSVRKSTCWTREFLYETTMLACRVGSTGTSTTAIRRSFNG